MSKFSIFISGLLINSLLYAAGQQGLIRSVEDIQVEEQSIPVIAIIMDDIGWRRRDDLNALDLPGSITYSILPKAPNTALMVEVAQEKGKEIMLHLPMEGYERKDLLGPEALISNMTNTDFVETVISNLQTVPGAVGINNHMGSLLTEHELSMHRLMKTLQQRGDLFFINSKTTSTRLPLEIAKLYDIPSAQRDVFLDHEKHPKNIVAKFEKLVEIAKRDGSALAICHPYPDTIETLDYLLSHLDEYGIKLITASEFMLFRQRENAVWQVSSSH